ncbi:MAG: cytochrome c biogenesis protein CcdA [Candidatus Omnitrophota bacterium]
MEELLKNLGNYLQSSSLLAYVAVFIGGLLISFTPCIYPVIPVTVGVIGSQAMAKKRTHIFLLSLLYALGIATTYSAFGAFVALTGKVFGQLISSSPVTYIIVGNICILLGLSRFEVVSLPFLNFGRGFLGINKKKTGLLGIYFLGLVSGLVVGPCTSAVLGAILAYVALKQNLLFGITLLFTFAFGMCILLIILGTFSGFLAALPKAGSWMRRVERFFGWVLIALGEYFLVIAGKYLI